MFGRKLNPKGTALGQLLVREAELRDLQRQWVTETIFGRLEAAAEPPPQPPKPQGAVETMTDIDKANARPLTPEQLAVMATNERAILASARLGEDNTTTLKRYQKLLPREIAARGEQSPTVAHLRRVIAAILAAAQNE